MKCLVALAQHFHSATVLATVAAAAAAVVTEATAAAAATAWPTAVRCAQPRLLNRAIVRYCARADHSTAHHHASSSQQQQ